MLGGPGGGPGGFESVFDRTGSIVELPCALCLSDGPNSKSFWLRPTVSPCPLDDDGSAGWCTVGVPDNGKFGTAGKVSFFLNMSQLFDSRFHRFGGDAVRVRSASACQGSVEPIIA